jgi:myo-inositol-1(or 4)-monophosphatase
MVGIMPVQTSTQKNGQPTPGTSIEELTRFLNVAFAACDGARQILNRHYGNLRHVDEKFQAGLVSEADKESEKFIVETIRAAFPDHGILGEESGLSGSPDVQARTAALIADRKAAPGALWMIDPLDGTTNYVHRFPVFCISIGLEINSELVVGVVDAPKLGSRYHAVRGGGAFLNGEPIHCSPRKQFREGLFATGFFETDQTLEEQLAITYETVKNSRGIRRAGAAALDLCFVAEGIFDAFWEKDLKPWDTAAGVCIAREAGAVATNMEGDDFNPRLRSVMCGAPAQHQSLLELIKRVRSR